MSDEYQSPTGNLAEATGKAFSAFNNSVFEGEGVIPKKYRQLIALAVAMTTQCDVCLRAHAADAVLAGASEEEIAETTYIAAALRAGGGIVHGNKALRSIHHVKAADE